MTTPNTQSFSALVTNFAVTVQGAAATLVDFTVGSVLRAISEAVAYLALWMQGLILQVGALSRAATSNGSDLDSWLAQFSFSRIQAVTATGQEIFSRYTATNQATIPIGATVQSSDGTVVFTTIVDATNPNYSSGLNAYVLPALTNSISVTVQCTQTGTIGNAVAGSINTLGTSISGVDYVSNTAAFTNGVNAETDSAVRSRFVLYLSNLGTATLAAIMNAITNVAPGVTGVILENQQFNGTAQNGYFTVIADDGTGHPSTTTLNAVGTAINAVRPLTVNFAVYAPTIVIANVSMTITTAISFNHATVAGLVQTAITNYINSIGDNAALPWSRLAATAYSVSGVANVTAVLLNGGTADLACTNEQRILAGTVVVS